MKVGRAAMLALAPAAAVAAVLLLCPGAAAETYWVADLPHGTADTVVALTNPGGSSLAATVTPAGGGAPTTLTVAPGATASFPTTGKLYGTTITDKGIYAVDAAPGLVVRQFVTWSPSVSADATTLTPERMLGTRAVVMDHSRGGMDATFYTVIATADTTVTVHPAGKSDASATPGLVPAMVPGTVYSYGLARGQALHVKGVEDLTGTIVEATQPIQVFGSSHCTIIGSSACDHLQEEMAPAHLLGQEYVVCASTSHRVIGYDLLRIVAAEGGVTTVTLDPAPAAFPSGSFTLGGAGAWTEFKATADVHIQATQAVAVGQYYGKDGGWDPGDPAFVAPMPIGRHYSSSAILFPDAWKGTIAVAAPLGAAVTLDGAAFPALAPVGGSGYGCAAQAATPGLHLLASSHPLDATALAVVAQGSFWYDAGPVAWPPPVPNVPPFASPHPTVRATCRDSSVTFDSLGTMDPDGTVVALDWDLGDGTTATGPTVVHTYAAPGTYTATLTVTDDDGATDAQAIAVTTVGDPDCPAALDVPDATVMAGTLLEFCVAGTDDDGGPFAYALSWHAPVPAGISFTTAGCFSWTPAADQAGTYPCLRFRVATPSSVAEDCATLRVLVPPRPGEPASDLDRDGVADPADNCVVAANGDQADADRDGTGDACEGAPPATTAPAPSAARPRAPRDTDRDGVADAADNCVATPNPDQADTDGDGLGDACQQVRRIAWEDGDGGARRAASAPARDRPADLASGRGDAVPWDAVGGGAAAFAATVTLALWAAGVFRRRRA